MKGRARVLAALAEHGVTEADYRKIERARQLVDEVNARLAERGSVLVYAVTMASAFYQPAEPPPMGAEITEQDRSAPG